MGIIENGSADSEDECAAGNYDQRVGEKLCAGVVLDIVPRALERGEQVDEPQREEEDKYQVEDDIVLGGVIVGYDLVQHQIEN
jgi:hypothetical protein